MIELERDVEIEVNKRQYNLVTGRLSSLIAYRKKEGKYYIKPLLPLGEGTKNLLEQMLNGLS